MVQKLEHKTTKAISNRRDKEYEEIIVTYSRFHKRIKY